jgi:hypothetical protein
MAGLLLLIRLLQGMGTHPVALNQALFVFPGWPRRHCLNSWPIVADEFQGGYTSPYRGPPINDDDGGGEESGFQTPVPDRPWGDIGGQYPASASQKSVFTANQRMQQTPYAAFGWSQSVCYQDPPRSAAPLVAE